MAEQQQRRPSSPNAQSQSSSRFGRPNKYHHQRYGHGQNQNRGPRPGGQQAAAGGAQQQRSGQRHKPMGPQSILSKYDNLMEIYVQARKKFFDTFHRGNDAQLEKVRAAYENARYSLRRFEQSLRPWQQQILEKKINGNKEVNDYALSQGLPPEGEKVIDVPSQEDPHILQSQQTRPSFKDDTEESMGTMEDYNKLKGLSE